MAGNQAAAQHHIRRIQMAFANPRPTMRMIGTEVSGCRTSSLTNAIVLKIGSDNLRDQIKAIQTLSGLRLEASDIDYYEHHGVFETLVDGLSDEILKNETLHCLLSIARQRSEVLPRHLEIPELVGLLQNDRSSGQALEIMSTYAGNGSVFLKLQCWENMEVLIRHLSSRRDDWILVKVGEIFQQISDDQTVSLVPEARMRRILPQLVNLFAETENVTALEIFFGSLVECVSYIPFAIDVIVTAGLIEKCCGILKSPKLSKELAEKAVELLHKIIGTPPRSDLPTVDNVYNSMTEKIKDIILTSCAELS